MFENLSKACNGCINPETLAGIGLDLEFQTTAVKQEYRLFMKMGAEMFAPVTEK